MSSGVEGQIYRPAYVGLDVNPKNIPLTIWVDGLQISQDNTVMIPLDGQPKKTYEAYRSAIEAEREFDQQVKREPALSWKERVVEWLEYKKLAQARVEEINREAMKPISIAADLVRKLKQLAVKTWPSKMQKVLAEKYGIEFTGRYEGPVEPIRAEIAQLIDGARLFDSEA